MCKDPVEFSVTAIVIVVLIVTLIALEPLSSIPYNNISIGMIVH